MLALIFLMMFLAMFAFSYAMRKWAGFKHPKWFEPYYVNDRHRKLDKWIRIPSMLLILAYSITIFSTGWVFRIPWLLQPWPLIFVHLTSIFILQAWMEKKYSDNPRAYVATIAEGVFGLGILLAALWSGVLGGSL
ncbi:DUF4181 domain-containing protein [Bhargavaea ullalensis]|uniref:DUF4181 domain-containing protein n=1 Tax=Bhargavaea ullalensis TaxID=1265685 RepID=A0ABV2GE08_9BACL